MNNCTLTLNLAAGLVVALVAHSARESATP